MFAKIGLKLIVAVSVATIILVSAFAMMNVRSQSDVLLTEIGRHSSQLSETIKGSTRSSMLSNNRESTHDIIQSIGMKPGVRDVRIYNKEGVIIYSADTTEIGQMVDKRAEACYTCHATDQPMQKLSTSDRSRIYRPHPDSSRVFGIINPVYNETSCWQSKCHAHSQGQTVLGVLDVTVSLKSIDKKIELSKIKMAAFALIVILALAGILWFFVRIWVDKPVRDLVMATKQVASGNLNHRIEKLGADEMGMLGRSFNNMTQKLSEARQQLFQSDKMASLGRLAAGVAHEINNPLTGILTYSSFLLKRTKDQPEMQEDLSVIVRETKRSREIVKGLLDFARQSVPKKMKANINEVIGRALTVVENQLSIRQIKVERKFNDNLPMATVDINQMQQVFTNLIVNASHAIGDEGGIITISTDVIALKPYGITQIKHAHCPKGHDLLDQDMKIDAMPSIKLRAVANGNEGYINLDPIYGKNRNHYGIRLPESTKIDISCPRCNISLIDNKQKCPECDSPVYILEVPGKGSIKGCVRKGCPWQLWEHIEQQGKKEFIEIKVADTGCGISEENINKIFEPFFTTKGQKGTGLGLAVIWGIMDNHDGSIRVNSKVGQGTTFTLRVPVDRM